MMVQSFRDSFWGPNGFEDLKKYMRFGNDFCKELSQVLIERTDIEFTYSKSLSKCGLRLQKLSKEFIGGLSDAWHQVALQFDSESEMHKNFAHILQDDLIKPLKILIDSQLKSRKPIETSVEKAIKNLNDKRAKDYKYRTRCFKLVKDIENTMYSLDEAQKLINSNTKSSKQQKEIQKLEDNLKTLKDLFAESELKYHKACGHVELARQEWQLAMILGCDQMQLIEEERITKLDSLLKQYTQQVGDSCKKLNKMHEILQKIEINTQMDIEMASKKYGSSSKIEQELTLIDVYSENTKNMMNRERRIENLKKWSILLQNDVQAQLKSKEGLEKVRLFNKENPKFSNSTNEIDIGLKINSVKLLQQLFDASLYKINSTLICLDSSLATPNSCYQYSSSICTTYDKLGIPFSILKLNEFNVDLIQTSHTQHSHRPTAPVMMALSSSSSSSCSNQYESIQMPQPCLNLYESSAPPSYRAIVNTTEYSNSIEYTDDDENNNNDDDNDNDDDEWNESERWLGQCTAQFDYKSERSDELQLKMGDVINILYKYPNGWYRGQLISTGKIGLFPSTYVKESN